MRFCTELSSTAGRPLLTTMMPGMSSLDFLVITGLASSTKAPITPASPWSRRRWPSVCERRGATATSTPRRILTAVRTVGPLRRRAGTARRFTRRRAVVWAVSGKPPPYPVELLHRTRGIAGLEPHGQSPNASPPADASPRRPRRAGRPPTPTRRHARGPRTCRRRLRPCRCGRLAHVERPAPHTRSRPFGLQVRADVCRNSSSSASSVSGASSVGKWPAPGISTTGASG